MKRRRSRRLAIQGQHEVTEFIGELGDAAAAVGEIHTAAQNAGRRAGLKGDGYIGTKVSQLAGSAADLANLAIDWPVTTTIGTMLAYQTAAGLLITDTQRDRKRIANRVDFARQGMAELTRQLHNSQNNKRTLILDFFRCVNAHPQEMTFTKDMIYQLDSTMLQNSAPKLLTSEQRQQYMHILNAAIDTVTTQIYDWFAKPLEGVRSIANTASSTASSAFSMFNQAVRGGPTAVDASATNNSATNNSASPTDNLFQTTMDVQVAIFNRNYPYAEAPFDSDL